MFIYKITNLINGKIYIGQTVKSVQCRWTQHKRDALNGFDYILYRAMRKHGLDNFSVEEIDGANSLSELNYKETQYIWKFNSHISQGGYNTLFGGNNKQSPQYVRDQIAKSSKRSWKNPEYRKKIEESASRNALKRYKENFLVYKAIKKGSSEKGEYVGKWSNQKLCSEALNIHPGEISSVLNGKTAQMKGYIFEYENIQRRNKATETLKNIKNQSREFFDVYRAVKKGSSEKGEYIGSWNNQQQCVEDLKLKHSTIPYCLSGRLFQSYGYIFEYSKEELRPKIKTNMTSESAKSIWNRPGYKEKMSNIHKNIKKNRNMLSISHGGQQFSVYKKDNKEFIGTWINQTKCAEDLNLCSKTISACLSGKNKTHKGYIFERIEGE